MGRRAAGDRGSTITHLNPPRCWIFACRGGRPDGPTARTATSPGPATNLSGAAPDQATARTAAGAGTGMGGVPPMMGPMMGGMNGMGGAGKYREPVTAAMTPDQAQLLGLEAVATAVPGGTIARKDDAA